MNEKPKVFLIGLDGGTFRVINPAIAAGKLPNLSQLIETGTRGVLISTIPSATIPAFPTLMTGMNPGKHGVFDFMQTKGAESKLVNGTDIQGQTLWRVLSDQGRKCIVMNIPLTYPPEAINGIVISGMMTPEGQPFTHPPDITKKLETLTEGYPVRFDSSIVERNPKQFVYNLHEMLRKRRKAIHYLLNQTEWDLFAILFRATDIVQHHLWQDKNAVVGIYQDIDEIIGDLVKREPEATFILFSDHGFGPLQRSFHVNIYLKSIGLLTVKAQQPSPEAFRKTKANQPTREVIIERTLKRLGFTRTRVRSFLPPKISRVVNRFLGARIRRYVPATHIEVDVENSKAYFSKTVTAETQSIILNAKTSDEYSNLVTTVKKKLSEVCDPQTGKPVVKAIFHRSEIYHGPFVEQAPDLIMLLEEGYKATTTLAGTQIIEAVSVLKGTHSIEGIFMAAGPDIKQKAQVSEINIQDLAPTILHLMQTSISKDVDGKVRKEIFNKDSQPFQQKPRYFKPEVRKRTAKPLSKKEEDEIKERLRSLGYLD